VKVFLVGRDPIGRDLPLRVREIDCAATDECRQQALEFVYTSPDQTNNRAGLANVGWRLRRTPTLIFSGNAYYRDIRTHTLNGDINEDSLDQSLYQPNAAERAALAAAGYTGVPTSGESAANTPFPFWRCIGNALLKDVPGERCNGLLNHTTIAQHTAGVAGQGTRFGTLGRSRHQLTIGAAFDQSGVGFTHHRHVRRASLAPDERRISGAPDHLCCTRRAETRMARHSIHLLAPVRSPQSPAPVPFPATF
jgi:hypothetical protein